MMSTMGKPKILCVDDETDMLDAAERALRGDFSLLRAKAGAEALDLLAQNPDVAVVLSDQRMPGMTGLELLTRVQKLAPEAVRAIMSGQIDLGDVADAINNARIHRFILKPWEPEVLRLHMVEAHQNYKLLREKNLLEKLSITDPLTQLTNHRYFQGHLRVEMERAQRHGRPLSLIMLDLDHFKSFNDRFGHPEGDRLLAAAAKRLLAQIRSIDRASRYGGEEFAIVMPDTGASDASRVAERIRAAFSDKPFAGPDGAPVRQTLSLGVATFPDHATDARELVEAADQALYRAKGQGRNAAVVAVSPKLLP